MDKSYDHKIKEKEILNLWESKDCFKTIIDKNKKPYCIILPPPNASGKMHTGNVLMIAIEDLLIRWKRMQGYCVLWVPGTDHAGFETQTTYERELKKQNKTRFDFDRQTLYQDIMSFVTSNKTLIEDQIKSMGASVDWSRYTFTLDDKSVKTVIDTFIKLQKDNKIYRSNNLVNYSFKWGTTFSDAEITYKENTTPLYYVKYKLIDKTQSDPEFITVATVRPETIFVDTHLAVNPNDKTKKLLVGKKVLNPLTDKEMNIIEDSFVDPEFGTGIVKITPAHDKNDYEVAKRHNLPVINLIELNGRLNENAGELEGSTILQARKKCVEILTQKGLIQKTDDKYQNLVPVDYRTEDYIEQLVIPNWFVKVDEMKKMAYEAVKNGDIKIYPKWREITYIRWVENMHDWAISRQIVWGIRVPVWYDVDKNPNIQIKFLNSNKEVIQGTIKELLEDYSFSDIEKGIQSLIAPIDATYIASKNKPGDRYIQETDTFDTWFSSGQWPLITLGYPDSDDFKYFYPTAVLETGWEIITRWVSRMVMFGKYLTDEVPFRDVYLHGIVRAVDGRKMSKSLGNVVNPDEYQEKYGTDALRMGLISGTANGKDFNFPHDRVMAYRNFANKIWNMARFILLMTEKEGLVIDASLSEVKESTKQNLSQKDNEVMQKLATTITMVNKSLQKYRFADAADTIYHFVWDDVAADYLEDVKNRDDKKVGLEVLVYVYAQALKLLHPFMPFVTEVIWAEIPKSSDKPLAISDWPKL